MTTIVTAVPAAAAAAMADSGQQTADGGRRTADGGRLRQAVGDNQPTNRQVEGGGGRFDDGWDANDGWE